MSKVMVEHKRYGPGCDETGTVNYKLPSRGTSFGKPPPALRNWDCRVDGHSDPDNSGSCIHCYSRTDTTDTMTQPTIEQIGVILDAVCGHTGVDKTALLAGHIDSREIHRCRMIAIMCIVRLFPEIDNKSEVARMIGVSSPSGYINRIVFKTTIQMNRPEWWDDALIDRLVHEIKSSKEWAQCSIPTMI